jgi:hypothetical protein
MKYNFHIHGSIVVTTDYWSAVLHSFNFKSYTLHMPSIEFVLCGVNYKWSENCFYLSKNNRGPKYKAFGINNILTDPEWSTVNVNCSWVRVYKKKGKHLLPTLCEKSLLIVMIPVRIVLLYIYHYYITQKGNRIMYSIITNMHVHSIADVLACTLVLSQHFVTSWNNRMYNI